MAFSAKFSDHLQSPTLPAFSGETLSTHSTHGFGGILAPPAASSSTADAEQQVPPTPRSVGLGPRRPSQGAVKKAAITEEADDDDDKDAVIRSLRLELEAERDLRRRVIEDYEVRRPDSMLPLHASPDILSIVVSEPAP